jgi:serine/threonine protein kinase
MKIYKYKINKKCIHQQQFHLFRNQDKNLDNYMNELEKSKYCIEYLLDLKDGNLYNIIDQLTSNQIYSMIIQITYALYLMHSKDFYHCDIHLENIAYIKTDLKYLDIFNYQIPTFGYIYSLIDYGSITSSKFKLNEEDIKFFEHPINKLRDNYRFISSIMTHKLFKYMDEHNISYYDVKKNIVTTSEFNLLFLQYPLNTWDSILPLLHSCYPHIILNIIGINKNHPKYKYYSKCYLTKDQVLFYLTNLDNPIKIIEYFYNLLDM